MNFSFNSTSKNDQKRLQHRLETAVKDAAILGVAGGAGFITASSAVQIMAKMFYLPASTLRGSIFATLGLGSACVASVYAADAAKHLAVRQPEKVFGRDDWERLEGVTATVICGGVIFALLGGRARSLLPSEFCLPGAFSMRKSALPTGTSYADPREKGAISFAGRLFGCHTCGDKRAPEYIADHMPPNKFAKKANARFYRRVFQGRMDVKQHFYPQCSSCSQIQSKAVNMERGRPTKLHLLQFRLYHLSGILISWWWFWSWVPLLE